MALRSLYLILSRSVQQLVYLRHAVAAILGFVGVKMAAEFFGFHVSSPVSLAVIAVLLFAGTAASLRHNRQQQQQQQGSGQAGKGGSEAAAAPGAFSSPLRDVV